MKNLLPAALVLCGFIAAAQTVTIRKVELVMEKVIVTYDLEDSNPNNEYMLNLYTSKDNFAVPMRNVTGDIGAEVKPGAGKRVEWLILQEYGNYKGKLALEIRGKVYTPVARLTNFDTKRGYKRGKTYDLLWKPGNTNPINIELIKGTQRISGDMNLPNNGSHQFAFAKNLKPGSDYRLRITDPKNPDEVVYTSNFKVTPKIPLYMKVAPVVVAGVLVVILLPDKTPTGTGNEIELPDTPQ